MIILRETLNEGYDKFTIKNYYKAVVCSNRCFTDDKGQSDRSTSVVEQRILRFPVEMGSGCHVVQSF